MNILFDIKHIAHVNFFKIVIEKLKRDNHNVLISYIERGRLPKIIAKEFPGIPSYSIGRHKGSTLSILFEANVFKFFKAFSLLKKHNIDVMLGVDAFTTGFACKLYGIPNVQFYDDPERKVNLFLEKVTSDLLYYPEITDFPGSKVQTYKALKEWAYLSPNYFRPDVSCLKELNLEPNKYLFVREVDTGSLNYKSQESSLLASAEDFTGGKKVVLSLEKKENRKLYPEHWIVLEEPVKDIHSIIYYSSAVISSGDSMAREGAMLGVPSFYVGTRDMAANRYISNEGMFFKVAQEDLGTKIARFAALKNDQEKFRTTLSQKWIDVSTLIHDSIFLLVK